MNADISIGARERLQSVGRSALADVELVALLLGTGTREEHVSVLAARILHEAGGLEGLSRLGVGALAGLKGVGTSKATRVLAALELGVRVSTRPLRAAEPIRSSRDVVAAISPRLSEAEVEHFVAIPLDARNRALGELRLSVGGLSACPVKPRDVFRALLREAAHGVIFAHNHPSGEPNPSEDDIALTRRLEQAGALLGVRVLDHIIVGREGYFSFLDAGLLPVLARP
jgi:DNA repair protein RadC